MTDYTYQRLEQLIDRRRIETGAATVSTLSDVNAVIGAVGGNSLFQGFWDRRLNVTASSGNVSAWGDCRSAGSILTPLNYFGSGTNPTISAPGSAVTMIATGATLSTGASSPVFQTSPSTVVFVCSSTQAVSEALGGLNGAGVDVLLSINGSNDWTATVGNNDITLTSATAASAVATIAVKFNGTTGAALVINNGTPITSSSATNASNATCNVVVGAGGPTGTAAFPMVVSAVLVLNVFTSSAQDAAIHSWAQTQHGSV